MSIFLASSLVGNVVFTSVGLVCNCISLSTFPLWGPFAYAWSKSRKKNKKIPLLDLEGRPTVNPISHLTL